MSMKKILMALIILVCGCNNPFSPDPHTAIIGNWQLYKMDIFAYERRYEHIDQNTFKVVLDSIRSIPQHTEVYPDSEAEIWRVTSDTIYYSRPSMTWPWKDTYQIDENDWFTSSGFSAGKIVFSTKDEFKWILEKNEGIGYFRRYTQPLPW